MKGKQNGPVNKKKKSRSSILLPARFSCQIFLLARFSSDKTKQSYKESVLVHGSIPLKGKILNQIKQAVEKKLPNLTLVITKHNL